jgi:hypothetical protein
MMGGDLLFELITSLSIIIIAIIHILEAWINSGDKSNTIWPRRIFSLFYLITTIIFIISQLNAAFHILVHLLTKHSEEEEKDDF